MAAGGGDEKGGERQGVLRARPTEPELVPGVQGHEEERYRRGEFSMGAIGVGRHTYRNTQI